MCRRKVLTRSSPRIILGLFLLLLVSSASAQDTKQAKPASADVASALTPKLFTLQGKELPLSKVLAELARQTDNQIEDRRQTKTDPKLQLALQDAPFWKALDTIAQEADARLSLYEPDGKIALRDGPALALPVSYSGVFRIAVKRLDAIRLLDPEAHFCKVYLEIAWEPRFQPFLMETQPESLVVHDDKGNPLSTDREGKGQFPISRKTATELELRVPAPRRSSARLGLLKGQLTVLGPSKMLTFTFDKLTKIEKRADARTQTQEGVTVHLRELRLDPGADPIWTIGFLLEYPATGPKFESFQSWLVNNEIYLEKGKQRLLNNLGYETDDQTENKAIIRYRFTDEPDKKLILGQPSEWKLVYRTAGKIVEMPVLFEFKDLPLP
jgi:hypothetical protein